MANNKAGNPVIYQTSVEVLTASDLVNEALLEDARFIMCHPDLDNDSTIDIVTSAGKDQTVFVWECRYGNILAKGIYNTGTVDLTKVRLHI